MKINRLVAYIVSSTLFAPSALAGIQRVDDWKSLLHSSIPMSMKISAIPADFSAIQCTMNGANPSLDLYGGGLYSSMFFAMAATQHGGNDPNQQKMFAAMAMSQVSWTNGDQVRIGDKLYLVTYKVELDLTTLAGSAPKFPDSLSLNLLATDSIATVKPRPDITASAFASALTGMTDVMNSEDKRADQTAHMSNVKQMALGMLMYTQDYDDVLPYAQDSKAAYYVTYPYVKNVKVFDSENPNGGIVRFNMDIAGVNADAIKQPAKVPMYYDSEAWPNGKRAVAFCDGHTKLVAESEWASMQAYMHLHLKKAAKPLPPNYGSLWDDKVRSGSAGGARYPAENAARIRDATEDAPRRTPPPAARSGKGYPRVSP